MLEALALGTPVVGMDCPGGVREILEPCPIGRTTPAGDVSQLGGAIVEALGRDAAESAPAEGLESFLDPFRVEHVMSLYEEVIRGQAAGAER